MKYILINTGNPKNTTANKKEDKTVYFINNQPKMIVPPSNQISIITALGISSGIIVSICNRNNHRCSGPPVIFNHWRIIRVFELEM